MSPKKELLADRLNAEPVIFRGCSSSELVLLVAVASAVWLPISLFVAWAMGVVMMGFGLAGMGIVATVVVSASLFQRVKRGRPEGYYQQSIQLYLHHLGIRRAPWILRTGVWDIGRTYRATLSLRD